MARTSLKALPTLADVDQSVAFEENAKHVAQIVRAVAAGRPLWWRRSSFHKAPFNEVEPKWHVFAGRTRSTDPDRRWDYTWLSLCGYEREFCDLLGGWGRQARLGAPKKSDRCTPCEHALAEIRSGGGASQGDEH